MNYIDLKNGIPIRDGGEPTILKEGVQAPDTSDAYAGEGKLHSVIDRLPDGTIIEQTKVKNRIIQREIHLDGKVVATYFIQQGQMLYQYDEKVIYPSKEEEPAEESHLSPTVPTTISLNDFYYHQRRIGRLQEEQARLTQMIDTGLKDGCYTLTPAEMDRAKNTRAGIIKSLLTEINASAGYCEYIRSLISALPNAEMRDVFEHRYYEAMTFEQVAEATFMCLTKVKRLHREGLAEINCLLARNNVNRF